MFKRKLCKEEEEEEYKYRRKRKVKAIGKYRTPVVAGTIMN